MSDGTDTPSAPADLWPCPAWCTQDHSDAPAGAFGHSTITAEAVPCVSGYAREPGAYVVEVALTAAGAHVLLSDIWQDYCGEMTCEAAEELGLGLLSAAALLGGANPAPSAVA